jgi:nitrogen fixation NifU-like protein
MRYSKKVLEYFTKPKNLGKIKNPDGFGEVTNPVCGDTTRFYLKIAKKKIRGKEQEYIKDIKFETMGCAAAIATSSIATELVKGKPLEQAKKLTKDMIIRKLGGLPSPKIHCSLLAIDALKKAVEDYEKKK